MTTPYDDTVNGLKDQLLQAITQHTVPDQVGLALLSLVAPDSATQQSDGSILFKQPTGMEALLLSNTVNAAVLHLVSQAAQADVQIMELKLGGNEQSAVAELLDALLWLSRQLPSCAELAVLPSMCIVHLTEMVPAMECEGVFAYLDTRIEELKAPHLANRKSRGTLLKSCNLLLKRLSKSHNAMLCGRILLFLAKYLPLAEESGFNKAGAFNMSNTTIIEDVPEGALDSQGKPVDAVFYRTFWILQNDFIAPARALDDNNWSLFARNLRTVLDKFKKETVTITESSPTGNVEAGSSNDQSSSMSVKYLSSSRLLGLQLKDATFRRHFLIQCLVLLQWCENPQHPMYKTLTPLKGKQLEEAKELRAKVYSALRAIPEKGPEFAAAIQHLLSVEDAWAAWKHAGCKSDKLQVAPAPVPEGAESSTIAATHAKKKRKVGADAALAVSVGTPELDRLWNITEDNVSMLSAEDRGGFKSLRQLMEPIIEEMNEPPEEEEMKVAKNSMYCWKSLRMLARDNLKVFSDSVSKGGDLEIAARALYPTEVPPEPVKEPEPVPTVEAAAAMPAAEQGEGTTAAGATGDGEQKIGNGIDMQAGKIPSEVPAADQDQLVTTAAAAEEVGEEAAAGQLEGLDASQPADTSALDLDMEMQDADETGEEEGAEKEEEIVDVDVEEEEDDGDGNEPDADAEDEDEDEAPLQEEDEEDIAEGEISDGDEGKGDDNVDNQVGEYDDDDDDDNNNTAEEDDDEEERFKGEEMEQGANDLEQQEGGEDSQRTSSDTSSSGSSSSDEEGEIAIEENAEDMLDDDDI